MVLAHRTCLTCPQGSGCRSLQMNTQGIDESEHHGRIGGVRERHDPEEFHEPEQDQAESEDGQILQDRGHHHAAQGNIRNASSEDIECASWILRNRDQPPIRTTVLPLT